MELLRKLTSVYGPSGNEHLIREFIQKSIEDLCDEIKTDALGNLIAHKKGTKNKILFAAHMDEIGVVVHYIDEKGFLRFGNVGGLSKKDLINRRVIFENGVVGVIGCEEEAFREKAEYTKLFIDIGAVSKEEAQKQIAVGDMAVFEGGFTEQNGMVIARALDNRVGCYVLIQALKEISHTDNDIYLVFTVQEEVGLRGAKTAAYEVCPDYAVAVDVTDTGDTPGAPVMAMELGKGAAVKIMDRSILCDHRVKRHMMCLAEQYKIPVQAEIMTDGGTDAGAIHLTGAGIRTGGISIPTRYIHSPAEMASEKDILSCVKLVKALMEAESF